MEIELKELQNIFSERLLSPVFITKGKQKMFEVFVITTLIIKFEWFILHGEQRLKFEDEMTRNLYCVDWIES